MFATAQAVDPAEILEAGIDALAEVDHRSMTGHERRSLLLKLQKLCTRLDAERVRLIASVDRNNDVQAAGAVNTQSWLRSECNLSRGGASRDVRTGRRLAQFPKWQIAFAAGNVTRTHVDQLVSAATSARIEQLAAYEDLLSTHAKNFGPESFGRVVDRACERIDDDHGADDAWDKIERRRVHLSTTLDGMGVLDGLLDPESTIVVNAGLEHHMSNDPDGEGESRTISQRRADALVTMARFTLAYSPNREQDATKRPARPAMLITADLERLCGTDQLDALRTERSTFGRLSTETLRRLTCDCSLSRVLTASRSEILDIGRRSRTPTAAQWRALIARDGGCTENGCDAPRWACEAHHIVHWTDGGETNLDNLQLKCWRHHRNHHEGKARAP